MSDVTEYNVSTGEKTKRAFTPEELAERQAKIEEIQARPKRITMNDALLDVIDHLENGTPLGDSSQWLQRFR